MSHLRRLAGFLAGMAATWLGLAAAAPAAFVVPYPLPAHQGQGEIWVIRLGKMGSFADELAGLAWLRLPRQNRRPQGRPAMALRTDVGGLPGAWRPGTWRGRRGSPGCHLHGKGYGNDD